MKNIRPRKQISARQISDQSVALTHQLPAHLTHIFLARSLSEEIIRGA
jgi:hypothetical protein